MHNEHMELRSEVGNQVEEAKAGKHELKSQIYINRGRSGRCRTAQLFRREENVVAFVPDGRSFVPDVMQVVPDGTIL